MSKTSLIFCFILLALNLNAIEINENLYINRGTLLNTDSVEFPYYAFNNTQTFNQENARLRVGIGDTLIITVFNNDTIVHGFNIKNYSGGNATIQPGDSTTITCSFITESVHIFYDNYNYPYNLYMGLGGMIIVSNASSSKEFYWNIKEHQDTYNDSISYGKTVDWQKYYPNYFTLNGKSAPNINLDTNARITGNVGDTLLVFITNTGKSIHSIHFHGYHSEIIYSSKFENHIGRIKDTFAIYSQEGIILKLIPDKPGEYPVHDHNLIAVSGGGMYPIGRFLTMLIQ